MKQWTQRMTAVLMAVLAAFAVSNGALAEPERDTVEVSAGGAVLMDARTHKVLYAKTAHEKLPMASTTKVMTAILAIVSYIKSGYPRSLPEVFPYQKPRIQQYLYHFYPSQSP